jgi:hypothetical protein
LGYDKYQNFFYKTPSNKSYCFFISSPNTFEFLLLLFR